ncbi:Cdk10 [Symbiodinium sp. CCMP2456]|nr:Cdk10 [Symbiodinium sp. CCMP2456]
MGPRESRPFSPAHMQICNDLPDSLRLEDANDESEAAWSEQEPDEDRHHGGLPPVSSSGFDQAHTDQLNNQPREPGTLRPLPPRRLPKHIHRTRPAYLLGQALKTMCNAPEKEETAMAVKIVPADGKEKPSDKAKEAEKEILRIQLQEEFVPVPGSIYQRSIVPGPGYYGSPKVPGHVTQEAATFGRKGMSTFDQIKDFAAKLPGPGQYEEKASTTDEVSRRKPTPRTGCFGKSPKLVSREEAFKKLPFISKLASACEGFGLHSSETFHCVNPEDVPVGVHALHLGATRELAQATGVFLGCPLNVDGSCFTERRDDVKMAGALEKGPKYPPGLAGDHPTGCNSAQRAAAAPGERRCACPPHLPVLGFGGLAPAGGSPSCTSMCSDGRQIRQATPRLLRDRFGLSVQSFRRGLYRLDSVPLFAAGSLRPLEDMQCWRCAAPMHPRISNQFMQAVSAPALELFGTGARLPEAGPRPGKRAPGDESDECRELFPPSRHFVPRRAAQLEPNRPKQRCSLTWNAEHNLPRPSLDFLSPFAAFPDRSPDFRRPMASGGALGYLGRCRGRVDSGPPSCCVEVFEKLNRLGQGSYGTVYRARDTENGEIVALKKVIIHAEKEGFPKSSLREIRLLKRLRHPNIVELREVACGRQPGSVFLVFEYCEHDVGALLDLMERPFSEAEVKCLTLQLLKAVECLHAAFVIHRDIKLSNLLLNNRGVLKLADFGLAREFTDVQKPVTLNVVTLWYRAPELLLGAQSYTMAVDMWSVGCNFGELLLKRPLLPGKFEEHQLQLTCALLGTPSPRIWPGLERLQHYGTFKLPENTYNNLGDKFPDMPDSCLDLLNRALTFDPAKRVTAAVALQHRWFQEAPAPQEPHNMPTWKEHRNETANPRANPVPLGVGPGKRPVPLVARSAVFAAAKKMKSCVF